MDGVIVLAFVLGSSANETVIPIALMIYTANNGVCAALSPSAIRAILDINGWDWSTAVSVILFTLFHWPCITTLLTIRKETGSMKWTAVAALIPTACGVSLCFILHCIMSLIR